MIQMIMKIIKSSTIIKQNIKPVSSERNERNTKKINFLN